MNNASSSYEDAVSATLCDATYLKGFWRLGQACMALSKTVEAKEAYTVALSLEKDNKALVKELQKVELQLEKEKKMELEKKEQEKLMQEQENNVSSSISTGNHTKNISTTTTTTTTKKVEQKIETQTKLNSSKQTTDDDEDIGDFTQSDHVRGYKIINGKKTSYFHHEQTEEQKRLIGDIAPKRLDTSEVNSTNNGDGTAANTSNDTSAWNKAGTWEEKDVTPWAIESLTNQLMNCTYVLPEGSPDPNATIRVVKLSKLDPSCGAHASVASVRGKKRYIFEFTVVIHWEVTLKDGYLCKGSITILDVDGTHQIGDGYDITDYTVDNDTPSEAKFVLERFVRDGGLRNVVEKCLDDWIDSFRETY
jgi:phosphopantetheinyl transferase (holo-ACP synthase)